MLDIAEPDELIISETKHDDHVACYDAPQCGDNDAQWISVCKHCGCITPVGVHCHWRMTQLDLGLKTGWWTSVYCLGCMSESKASIFDIVDIFEI